jgi:hypothetical protein
VNHVSVATPVCDVRFTLHKQTFSTPSRSDLRLGASAGQFRTASSASAAKRGELLLQLVWREADAFTGFPTKVFTSVERFSRARSWNDRGRFANVLGLRGMFLTLGVIVLAVRISGGPMGLRCGLVMFRRFVVCVFHVISRCWPKNIGPPATASIVAAPSANSVPSKWRVSYPTPGKSFAEHARRGHRRQPILDCRLPVPAAHLDVR